MKFDLIGGRKFLVWIILFIVSTIFLLLNVGQIDFQQWADFQVWSAGIYGVANGASKAATKAKDNGTI